MTTILLDAADTNRRLVQQVVPLAGAILIVAGLAVAGKSADASRLFGGLAAGFGAGLLVAAARPLIHWDIAYKGHIIRFENHSVLGERLYIRRRTHIKNGDGAGIASHDHDIHEARRTDVAERSGHRVSFDQLAR